MKIAHLLFHTHGRISRKIWWISNIAIWCASLTTTYVFAKYGFHDALIGFILTVMLFWFRINLNIKRMHDHGKSGWWILFAEIPIVGWLYGLIVFGFMKGSEEANEHGEPLATKDSS